MKWHCFVHFFMQMLSITHFFQLTAEAIWLSFCILTVTYSSPVLPSLFYCYKSFLFGSCFPFPLPSTFPFPFSSFTYEWILAFATNHHPPFYFCHKIPNSLLWRSTFVILREFYPILIPILLRRLEHFSECCRQILSENIE